MLPEKDQRWNKFIMRVCEKEPAELTGAARFAVLCFDYDTEVNVGGHKNYFETYPSASPDQMEEAIRAVGNEEIALNFRAAFCGQEEGSFAEADNAYFGFSPSLSQLLMDYVEEHKDEIFA